MDRLELVWFGVQAVAVLFYGAVMLSFAMWIDWRIMNEEKTYPPVKPKPRMRPWHPIEKLSALLVVAVPSIAIGIFWLSGEPFERGQALANMVTITVVGTAVLIAALLLFSYPERYQGKYDPAKYEEIEQ